MNAGIVGKNASRLMAAVLALACADALAQATPPPPPEPEEEGSEPPSSVEQGKVELNDSFEPLTRRERIRQQRAKAFKDTKVDAQLRTYLLDRDKFDGSESTSMAIGGYIGARTGWFRDRFAIGATAYTSQKLYGPEDKDGAGLLQSGQNSYSVLGEAYLEYRFNDTVFFDIGRKAFNSPYINKNDTRMTPNTFELAMVQGVIGDPGESGQWRFGLGYVDEIKTKTSEIFVSMSDAAGAPGDLDNGVVAGGVNFTRGPFSIGAVDYYNADVINIFYTEGKYQHDLSDSTQLRLGAQYSAQKSVGDDLLTGSDFDTWQWGVKGEVAVGNALFTAAWNGTGDGADLRSPWGGIPSYNSVQVQDFNRAGEDSLMLRAAYDFKSVPGLSVYGLWVNGSQPDNPAQSEQDEYDFNLQWAAREGMFKGLSVRLRYAVVTQEIGGPDLQDFRLIINYDPPSL
jgi:hypothetical protein